MRPRPGSGSQKDPAGPGVDAGSRNGSDFAGRIAFRCHGLEFAKARLVHHLGSLRRRPRLCLESVRTRECLANPTRLSSRRLVHSVGEVRHAEGPRDHALWRLHPERWLESLVVLDVTEVDERRHD